MSQRYSERPSEILGIDDWLAYCLDEICMYYENSAYDEETGFYDFELLSFSDRKNVNPNQKFIDFIQKSR